MSRRLEAGAKLAQYKVVRLLGEGGMGAVYEALDESLDRHVAVKTLLSEVAQDPESRKRFFREGKAAAKLRHPHVVEVYGVGIEEDVPYLVMELLSGESLASLLDREKKLPSERVVDLLLPVLSALVVAHHEGVIHRDLKPDNIFLQTTRARTVVPKLLDFGISKVTGLHNSRITHTSALMGTPFYMSPEQARGSKEVDEKIDQWAMGVILYESLAGVRPIEGETVLEILHRIATMPIRPLHDAAPEVPEGLSDVVMRALHREPESRWPSMAALSRALLPFATVAGRTVWTAAFEAGSPSERPPPPKGAPAGQASAESTVSAERARSERLAEGAETVAASPRSKTGGALGAEPAGPAGPPRPEAAGPSPASTSAGRKTGAGLTRNLPPERDPRASTGPVTVPTNRSGLVAIGVAAVAVALIGVLVAFGGGGEASAPAGGEAEPRAHGPSAAPPGEPRIEPRTEPPTEARDEPSAPPAPAGQPSAAPSDFEASLRITPASARIEIDGAPVGAGQWSARLPLDGATHSVRVSAEGYEEARFTFTDAPPPHEVTLTRAPAARTPREGGRDDGSRTGSARASSGATSSATTSEPRGSMAPTPTLGANGAPILE